MSVIGQREEFRDRTNCFLIGPLVARLGIEGMTLENLRDALDASECGNECLKDHRNPRQAFLGDFMQNHFRDGAGSE